MAKPSTKPAWVPGGDVTRVVEPPSGKKNVGWDPGERPAAQYMNWFFKIVSDWIEWQDAEVAPALAAVNAVKEQWDAIVGSNVNIRTHADLQDAIDDVNAGARILVLDNVAMASRVSISKNNIEIVFKPGVTYSKNADTIGFDITGVGIKIRNGRITGFSGGSDVAIRFGTAADYGMVRDMRFSNNANDVQDLTTNATVTSLGNVTEV